MMRGRAGRLLRRCLPARAAAARVVLWSLVESAPALLSGLTLAHAVDAFRTGHAGDAIGWLALLGVAIVAGGLATRALYSALAPVVEDMRDALMDAVAEGALATLGTTGEPGVSTVTQLVDQVDQVRNLLSALLRSLRSTVAPLVAACIGLLLLDARLGLAVAVPLVVAVAGYALLLPRTVQRQRAAAVAEERFGADLTAVVGGLRAVRGLGAEGWAQDRLAAEAQATGAADFRAARAQSARHLVIAAGASVPLLSVLLVAAPLTAHHQLSAGALVGATTYVLTVLAPALGAVVSGAGGWLVHLSVLLDRLAAVAEVPPPACVELAESDGDGAVLTARGLSFAFRAGARPVLHDLDLSLRPDELLAVVGPSGAGKSTLAALLAGLLEPTAGTVHTGTGRRLCLLPQDAYVFTGSLRDNLGYLAPEPVGDAALAACVDRFGLRPLADRAGLDTPLPADELATGERQRIVLARAYLSGADVLVLDEATANLDRDEEAAVEAAFRAAGRTLIVVAHRLDLVTRADRVAYFDGASTLVGTHQDLLARSPDYRELITYAAPAR